MKVWEAWGSFFKAAGRWVLEYQISSLFDFETYWRKQPETVLRHWDGLSNYRPLATGVANFFVVCFSNRSENLYLKVNGA